MPPRPPTEDDPAPGRSRPPIPWRNIFAVIGAVLITAIGLLLVWKLKRILTWLGELIETSCSAAPVVVGHLGSGAIAARFAARHSESLRSLVLVDSFGLGRFRPTRQHCVPMPSRVRGWMGRSGVENDWRSHRQRLLAVLSAQLGYHADGWVQQHRAD